MVVVAVASEEVFSFSGVLTLEVAMNMVRAKIANTARNLIVRMKKLGFSSSVMGHEYRMNYTNNG